MTILRYHIKILLTAGLIALSLPLSAQAEELGITQMVPSFTPTLGADRSPAPMLIDTEKAIPEAPQGTKSAVLTLQDAVLLALRFNPEVRNAQLDRITQKFALLSARNQFQLQYQLTGGFQYNGGLTDTQSYTLSPQVSWNTPTGGTVSAALAETGSLHVPGTTASPQSALTVSVTQPLLRGAGEDVTLANLRNAYDQEAINKLTLKQTIMSTITSVITAYRQVVSDEENITIQKDALQNNEESLRDTQLQIQAGRVARTEAVQAEQSVAQSRFALSQAENQAANDRQALLTSIGLNPYTAVTIPNKIDIDEAPLPNLSQSIALALENNPGYQGDLVNLKVLRRQLLIAKDAQRWQLNLAANVTTGSNVFGGSNGPPETIFSFAKSNRTVGLNFSIPIENYSLRSQLISARVALQEAEINNRQARWQVITNITTLLQDLTYAKEQIGFAAQSLQLQQQNYAISRRKLSYGLISLLDLKNQQQNLTSAQQSLLSAQIAYLNALSNFELQVGTTLDVWGVTLRY